MGMRRTRKRGRGRLTATALVLLLLTGCAGDVAPPDRAFIVGMRNWLGGIDRVEPFYRHIEDLLPNRRYRRENGFELQPVSSRVVVGEFIDATPGAGFLGTGKRIGYGDKRAAWHTMHAEFRVDEVIAGPSGERVTVGWPSNGTDVDKNLDGLISLGRVVLFLTPSAVYDYDEDLLAVAEDGAFIATVAPHDELALPLIAHSRGAVLLERVGTLAELRAEARERPRTIQLRENEGIIEPLP